MSEKLTEAAARLVIEAEKVAVERERIALEARRLDLEVRKHEEAPRRADVPTGTAADAMAEFFRGHPGAKGEQGPAGIPGVDGQHGRDGAPGERGPDGRRGEPGPEGRRGFPGIRGDAGPAGPVGPHGPKGDTGPAGVPGMVWRGAFSQGVTYAKGDAVELDGSSWIAKAPTNARPHASASSWDLLAKKGEEGAPGAGSGMGPVTMPADSIVVEAIAGLAADDVQAALAELHSDIDNLPPSAVEAVTEANGLDLTTGTLSLAAAGAAQAGAVTTGAQELGGVKTLTGAILNGVTTIVEATTALIRAIGVSLVLRSSLGAGASDKCVVVGSSEVDGTVNAAARLQEWQTGIGGAPVTKAYINKAGQLTVAALIPTSATAPVAGFYLVGADIPAITGNGSEIVRFGTGTGVNPKLNAAYAIYLNGGSSAGIQWGSAASARLTTEMADGATAVAGVSNTSAAWSNAGAKLWSFRTNNVEKAFVGVTGEFEGTTAGAGIVLKSPDGTRYRLTVANGGTLSIAAA